MDASFERTFGRPAPVVAAAHGRVNLIGEHTDYNGGAVLPTAIPQRTVVALAPAEGRRARVRTTLDGTEEAFEIGAEAPRGSWGDYVAGCTWALAAAGHALGGFDASVASDVPAGAGLSSSAALTVACLRALREGFGLVLDDVTLARVAHRAETEFVGARVGPMDPMAVGLADASTALFLDTRTLAFERVPLPEGAEIVVIDSGVRHRLVAGGYNHRRAECEQAARLLGVPYLCALEPADAERIVALPEPLGRRVRHVVGEHARVLAAVRALRAGDVDAVGQLFLASHGSQRDDFAVSVPEVDALVELGWNDPEVLGARLTGGGFGGAVVMLVRRGAGAAVAARVIPAYERAVGRRAALVMPVTR